MRSAARSSALALACCCLGAGFFSNPVRLASLTPPSVWETADIGAVWSDSFNRSSLGSNWIVLGDVNASLSQNELQFAHTNTDTSRQVYYQPWLTSSDQWTLQWSQRFATLDAGSVGVGVGLKNFQANGGNDRGYNAWLSGAGANLGQLVLERWDGTNQNPVSFGPPLSLAAGDIVDCRLTRAGWTISGTASNQSNGQLSSASLEFSDAANLEAPTISRICLYPFQGTVLLSNISFVINHRKPARFIVIGASISEGYNASTYAQGYVRVMQSNIIQVVCNDSGSYNTTTDSLSLLPEILVHGPDTAVLMIGGNDLNFQYPADQWQAQYSNLVVQLQSNGVKVIHCLPTPESTTDLRPLKTWISTNYSSNAIIDTWTPLVSGASYLNPAYVSSGSDGTSHPNDAGHLLIGQIIRTNLP